MCIAGPTQFLHSGGGTVRVRHEPRADQDQGRQDPHQVPGAHRHALRVRPQRGAARQAGRAALHRTYRVPRTALAGRSVTRLTEFGVLKITQI